MCSGIKQLETDHYKVSYFGHSTQKVAFYLLMVV